VVVIQSKDIKQKKMEKYKKHVENDKKKNITRILPNEGL
jgi:hypothetical protein